MHLPANEARFGILLSDSLEKFSKPLPPTRALHDVVETIRAADDKDRVAFQVLLINANGEPEVVLAIRTVAVRQLGEGRGPALHALGE